MKKKRKQEICVDFFNPLIGSKNIYEFMCIGNTTFFTKVVPDMKKYGLIWKSDRRKTSPLMTTKYLINIYYVLKAQRQQERI
jgi:hypothetical protein